jgi:hypothetical protein
MNSRQIIMLPTWQSRHAIQIERMKKMKQRLASKFKNGKHTVANQICYTRQCKTHQENYNVDSDYISIKPFSIDDIRKMKIEILANLKNK